MNLDDPEEVKGYIANINKTDGYKRILVNAYQHYISCKGHSWNKPVYKENSKLPKIPTE